MHELRKDDRGSHNNHTAEKQHGHDGDNPWPRASLRRGGSRAPIRGPGLILRSAPGLLTGELAIGLRGRQRHSRGLVIDRWGRRRHHRGFRIVWRAFDYQRRPVIEAKAQRVVIEGAFASGTAFQGDSLLKISESIRRRLVIVI